VRVLGRGLYPPEVIGRSRQEVNELSVDQVRRIVLAHAAYPPHEGRARVFIVRDADELSIGAANALLKTLEEPRPQTYFVLLSARADRLLPTIRSRTLPIRFAPLSDGVLRSILGSAGVPDERQALAIELAGGSASTALALANAERSTAHDEFVAAILSATSARDLGPAVVLAESRESGRDQVKSDLRALCASLAWTARSTAPSSPRDAVLAAYRYEATLRAIERLERNASPSLTVIELVSDMRAAGATAR
jgi:DNA polymerase-3 subunit delta'